MRKGGVNLDINEVWDFIDKIEDEAEKSGLYETLAKISLENAENNLRAKFENHRDRCQVNNLTHDQIKLNLAVDIGTLLGLTLLEVESRLDYNGGIIDLLAIDANFNVVGLEVKKRAGLGCYDQIIRYRNSKKMYGVKARLILIASSYTHYLLNKELEDIELLRYEISLKQKGQQLCIGEIRVAKYSKESTYENLFENDNSLIKKLKLHSKIENYKYFDLVRSGISK